MKVAVLLVAGRPNLEAAFSSVRVLEELGAEEVTIVYTSSEGARMNAKTFKEFLEKAGFKVEMKEVPSDSDSDLEERVKKLKEVKADVVAVSPGGASLAAAASKAFNTIAHVSFPFSLWRGLYFPYVPRTFQKVYFLPSSDFNTKFTNYADKIKVELNHLGPIRKRVAELTKRINEATDRKCPEIEVKVDAMMGGFNIMSVKFKLCGNEEEETKKVFSTSLRAMKEFIKASRSSRSWMGFDSSLYLSGLLPIKVGGEGASTEYILDTSSILIGALNLHNAGLLRARVPRCALYELLHKYEESLKRSNPNYYGLLAKYVMEEAKALVFPSPTDLCDKAFFQIDPLLLDGKVILTEDNGIKEMWKETPLSKLARVESPRRVDKWEEAKKLGYYNLPYVTFALLQFYVIMKLLAEEVEKNKISGEPVTGSLKVDNKTVDEF
ncbi:hypothetical protein [Ignicoccus hospitalis]|uniref:Uncharacterized protein n=1 Tax=Ignicoccus hospitalis (strain KIN4/I / DSM 18386 / JCM 14125) TaxID=453591 RepID=A8A9Z7_IGNH4|nr:hypothetical protein [Ignicoccus hospitalis]ABU81749.1 hypothetical protein Igni_0567 [Ignicoccus hospitalis KIN4/I]HIH90016.1 hypothetical protein [Desulfurococcaceae archaeon]